MSWVEASIMARKGVARGKPGRRHEITEATQGKYHYVYGPFASTVLTVDPGDVINCETHDAFEGKILHETDKPSEILNFPVPQPAERPDLRERRGEGRLPRRPYPFDQPARAAAGGDHLRHPGVRRAGGHGRHRIAEQPAAGAGEKARSHR